MKKLDFKNLKIVENSKKFLIAPIAIVAVALIMLLIFGLSTGNAVNVGMDFTGGYKMTVRLGTKLTDETYDTYEDKVVDIVESLKDEDGKEYGIKVEKVERVGEGSSAAITIQYRGIKDVDDKTMTEVVDVAIEEALEDALLNNSPSSVQIIGNTIVAKYDFLLVGNVKDFVVNSLNASGIIVESSIYEQDDTAIRINLKTAVTDETAVNDALVIPDIYAGNIGRSGYTSSTVSSELLERAVLAVIISIVLMFIYILFRFETISGLAAIVALAHDIIIMLCGMFIFHLPFNSTIVAALITILGYSINNTIIIFDRIRELRKEMAVANNAAIVNRAIENTMSRTILTTFTTLVMIVLVAIIGVEDIRIFALPIIFGLLAGFYSANFLAPTFWAWLSGAPKKQTAKKTK